MYNPRIFTTLPYFEPWLILNRRLIRNHVKHWPGIFRTLSQGIIQPYSDIFRTLGNARIRRNLVYSESWNIQNPSITASWRIFRTCHIYENFRILKSMAYLKGNLHSEHLFKMELFAIIFKSYNYFPKALYLRSLTGLWMSLSHNKYSLTCRLSWRWILYDTYSEPCLLS